MPPRAVRDGNSSFYANNRLRWPGLCEDQAEIVITYLLEDRYVSQRSTPGPNIARQRLALGDAIFLHFQSGLYHLPGLGILCCLEFGRIAFSMPVRSFAESLNDHSEWVRMNSGWVVPFVYHRIRTRIPSVVAADREEFNTNDAADSYLLLVALVGAFLIAFNRTRPAQRESSD
ncbi:hypothetical protein FLONG3_3218 [Fusarium longipes]|uniref:Uncharacterized protein n=1 Tax=Fusarium longipes TaxID=694270 RepID=A0A395T1Y2_9HYPO|nr:hypothetical protein FLONG3_3218 [Fusarium longipes]